MLATSASTNAAAAGFQQIAAPQLKQAAQQAQQAANTLQAQARDAWKRVDSAKAVAHVIDPTLLSLRPARVTVDTGARTTRGQTRTEFQDHTAPGATLVATVVDAPRFRDLLLTRVR